jgi:Zn-dependent protease/predicted transcriptional regulator
MFGKSIRLFKLFGFEVKLDLSWLILAFLITWSLAEGLFPHYYKGLNKETYWVMGGVGAIGLFLSIIFHEMSHSLVARRYGLAMKGITLFIFGGVAEMEDEPSTPKAEFLMAIAGPISSVVLCGGFYGVYRLGGVLGWILPVKAVLNYLAWINGILAIFNMLPAFPLDGGRVLRSGLWKLKNNVRWATKVASEIGAGFGMALIILGALSIISGNLIGGVWWFLIGMFLRNASAMSYRQLVIRRALEGEHVDRFMKEEVVAVSPFTPVDKLVEDYFYKYHYKFFPVVENTRLMGCINTQDIKHMARQEWDRHTVGEMVHTCSPDNTVDPDTDAIQVLATMNRTHQSRLMVVKGEHLLGVITLKDMLRFLSLKLDLEDGEELGIPKEWNEEDR